MLSFRTKSGAAEPVKGAATKIVRIEKFTGAISYFGLATLPGGQRTLEWLREQASKAESFESAEVFANHLRDELNSILGKATFRNPLDKGIGMHFTAFERVNGELIPELFAITNFSSTDYNALHMDGVHATRETFANVRDRLNENDSQNGPFKNDVSDRSEHGAPRYRNAVLDFLRSGRILLYNNGNPRLFNIAQKALLDMLNYATSVHILQLPLTPALLRRLAQFPISYAVMVQQHFFKRGFRPAGGRTRNLSVTRDGSYCTDTDK